MHNSDDPKRLALVTCYLDESGTDDDNEQAVVAGILLNKHNFEYFEQEWARLLSNCNINPPIHMNEFGENGKFGYLRAQDRFNFFSSAIELANNCKVYSVAATLNKQEYEEHVDEKIRKNFSIYGFCFMLLAYVNERQAQYMNFKEDIAYLFDNGAPHKNHIINARDRILKWEKENKFIKNMGSLSFNGDVNISAFQIADVLAWGVRRKISNKSLNKGFEPIENLFHKENHMQYGLEGEFLEGFAKELNQLVPELE